MEFKRDEKRRELYKHFVEVVEDDFTVEELRDVEDAMEYVMLFDYLVLWGENLKTHVPEIMVFDAEEIAKGLEEHKGWAVQLYDGLGTGDPHFRRVSWNNHYVGTKAMCEHWAAEIFRYKSGDTRTAEKLLTEELEKHYGERIAWTGDKRDFGREYHCDGLTETGQELEYGVFHKRAKRQGKKRR